MSLFRKILTWSVPALATLTLLYLVSPKAFTVLCIMIFMLVLVGALGSALTKNLGLLFGADSQITPYREVLNPHALRVIGAVGILMLFGTMYLAFVPLDLWAEAFRLYGTQKTGFYPATWGTITFTLWWSAYFMVPWLFLALCDVGRDICQGVALLYELLLDRWGESTS